MNQNIDKKKMKEAESALTMSYSEIGGDKDSIALMKDQSQELMLAEVNLSEAFLT